MASLPHWAPTARRQRLVSEVLQWSPGTACTAVKKAVSVSKGPPPWHGTCYWHVLETSGAPFTCGLAIFPKERENDLSLCLPNPPHPPHRLLVVTPRCPRLVGRKPPGSSLPATAPAGRLLDWWISLWSGEVEGLEKREESRGVMDGVVVNPAWGYKGHRAQIRPRLHWFCCLQSISNIRCSQSWLDGVYAYSVKLAGGYDIFTFR